MKKRRIDAENGIVYSLKGEPLRTEGKRDYLFIRIDGKRSSKLESAHRMIWAHVNGPIPEGMEINHINGLKHDNRIANLELVTPSQNMIHAYANRLINRNRRKMPNRKPGNPNSADTNGMAKLSWEDVREIRRLRGVVSQKELAKRFGVSSTSVGEIQLYRSWVE